MITSTSNERIKHITQLVKSAKARRKEGIFVIEGERIAREIPKERMIECFVSDDFEKRDDIKSVFGYETGVTVVSSDVFSKMSDTKSPQGILCVCRQEKNEAYDFIKARGSGRLRLLVLEGIQDPGNLGTMIRTAEGAGFDAVIADPDTVDVYNPKVTRSTMGSLFRVPVMYTDDLLSHIDMLKSEGITVYAAHLKAESSFREENYPERVAFLIGNEGNGLSDAATEKADRLIGIPMKGKLESLNAAVAAALLMYNV